MKTFITNGVMLALLLATSQAGNAGLRDYFGKRSNCETECGDYCCAEPCATMCVPECKRVKVKKHCWQTECEEICIPPVTLPTCRSLFKGKCDDSCGADGCCDDGCCTDGCCDEGCGSGCQDGCGKSSLLQRIFGKCAGCRTRCVSRLKKHEYECEETVVEWKCVSCGGCGDGCCETGACCEPACCAPGGCQ